MGYQPPPPAGAKRPIRPPAQRVSPVQGTGVRVCRREDIFVPTRRDEENWDEISRLQERIGKLDMRLDRVMGSNKKLRRENLELKEKLLKE